MTYLIDSINPSLVPSEGFMTASQISNFEATRLLTGGFTNLLKDTNAAALVGSLLKLRLPVMQGTIHVPLRPGDVFIVAQTNKTARIRWVKLTIA